MESISVYFRKFPEGDIIALWCDRNNNEKYVCSYMHVGQHSEASGSLIHELEKATYLEYEDLMNEMKGLGYNITVLY